MLLAVAIEIYPLFNLCAFARRVPRFQRKNQIRRLVEDPNESGSADRAVLTAIRTSPRSRYIHGPTLAFHPAMYHPSYESSSSSSTASSPPPYDYYPPTAFVDPHQQHYLHHPQPFPKSRPQKAARHVQVQISHPYARLFAKKDEVKRRKIWNHALEKNLFNPFELQVFFWNL